MILVESSAWVLFFRGELDLEALLGEDEDVATCPPIIQEVLQGADSPKRYARAREALFKSTILDAPLSIERFEQAAQLYLRCRRAGLTIRKSTDCLIAVTAIAHDLPVMYRDRDFDHIAAVVPFRSVRV